VKAKVIEVEVFENLRDFANGNSYYVRRLVVQDLDGLTITPYGNQLYVDDGISRQPCEVLGEVDVPDELIQVALRLLKAKNEANAQRDEFEKLLVRI
jgi:hypothetical protein